MPAARINAPFTAAQAQALTAFARLARLRHAGPDGRLCGLSPVAAPAGWRCPCGWRRFRAFAFMAGGGRPECHR